MNLSRFVSPMNCVIFGDKIFRKMSVAEIQNDIVRKVLQTENLDFLRRLQEFFKASAQDEDWWFTISEEERKRIEIGNEQIEAGLGIPHEEVRREIDERLKKHKK